jgi:benzoyl-CoA reductase/2-hydroxyglutaryl-CoA dehydratase subunit BcrC/BadD/HgdB
VTYYQQLKSDLAERVARKIGAIPQEKYRLYWDNIPIWFKLRELSQKFASYNANLVTGVYPYTWALTDLDPKQPLESITRSMIYFVTNAGIRGRADFITKLVQDYSLDGLVAQSSRSCRLMNMGQYDIMNLVTQRTGCPAVFIEGDMCDERVYSESEVDSKIDAFMELLAQRSRAS